MARKSPKRQNGQGNSITLNFNLNDPQEAAALAMSKRLAGMKKGKRKDFIIAMLAAAERVYQETGQLVDTYEVTAAIMSNSGSFARQPAAFRAEMPQEADAPRKSNAAAKSRRQPSHPGGVEVTRAGSSSAEKVAANFLRSVSNIASGFFD